ncbi:MAG: YraN family protein [Lachnospiraceae bacterium]|nr:YraN family protein [Lachnospiraceae bacterium]
MADTTDYKKGSTRYEGHRGEEKAAAFLERNGVRIVTRNFRCRTGEIDIIGLDGNTTVFFEVKCRKDSGSGMPYEAVGIRKQRRICMASDYYRMKARLAEDREFRFDVISIIGDEISWYKNAFGYIR